ncbi:MAG: glutathione S-transferase [Myxococcota bacterium]|nr:glutathione S-transferase [Myxococcota bacterium]
MKLYSTPTSPFVRKVMIVAHEVGVADRIETTFLRPSPMQPDEVLSRDNPLSKIPALVLDDGSSLYDSHVICEYLDAQRSAGATILPTSGPARWTALRREALANGMLEAAVQVFYERRNRPEELQWAPWIEGQSAKVRLALDALEREAGTFGDGADLGSITIAAALGWLEFRGFMGDLRTGRPALFAWYDRFCERPSMRATTPHD